MCIPFTIDFLPPQLNFHFIMETLAFIIGFRVYVYLKKGTKEILTELQRLATIVGAMIGALVGSRVVGFLELPLDTIEWNLKNLYFNKSIAGGFLGGMLGVEFVKLILKIRKSTGDLYVYPILIALIIGRIGCWLTGIQDGTYGVETHFFLGMNLGDGLKRHPTSLYEILFSISLIVLFYRFRHVPLEEGSRFKLFMIGYFLFRFLIEFIKPHAQYFYGLNSIQWSSILVFIYYIPFVYHLSKSKK